MNIPAKEWNEMKGVMEDTSLPEWQEYYRKLKAHNEHYDAIRPMLDCYPNYQAFRYALTEWEMDRACFAPNKPGYYRANND